MWEVDAILKLYKKIIDDCRVDKHFFMYYLMSVPTLYIMYIMCNYWEFFTSICTFSSSLYMCIILQYHNLAYSIAVHMDRNCGNDN